MSKEPKTNDTTVQKLLMDNPSDFKFHAAYMLYSQAWDNTSSEEDRNELNEVITLLSKGEIDYQGFYEKMHRHRTRLNHSGYHAGGRTRIETQRKRDWRKKEAKNLRNKRYRK
jgi:hypothetical protein